MKAQYQSSVSTPSIRTRRSDLWGLCASGFLVVGVLLKLFVFGGEAAPEAQKPESEVALVDVRTDQPNRSTRSSVVTAGSNFHDERPASSFFPPSFGNQTAQKGSSLSEVVATRFNGTTPTAPQEMDQHFDLPQPADTETVTEPGVSVRTSVPVVAAKTVFDRSLELATQQTVQADEKQVVHGSNSVSGQVVDQYDNPLFGIGLTVMVTLPDSEDTQSYSVSTDASGYFQATGLADSSSGYRVVAANMDDYQDQTLQLAAEGFGVMKLENKRYLTISGHLLSNRYEPLSEVEVMPMSDPGSRITTGEDGSFHIRIAQSRANEKSQIIKFMKAGYRKQFLSINKEDWDKEQLNWEVQLTGKNSLADFSGVVLGNNGDVISGALVKVSSPETRSYHKTVTDNNGVFRLQGIETARDYRLRVYPGEGLKKYARNDLVVSEAGLTINITIK